MKASLSSQVDIWSFELNHPQWNDLSEDEWEQSQAFQHPQHQIQFASGRSTLKAILNRYVDLPPFNQVIFDKNEYGKLYLKEFPYLQFNLSHSKNQALVAVGYEHSVGVDLEHHQAVAIFDLAEMLYSSAEIEGLKKCPQSLQNLAFFNVWAKKEAFIKAIGMGLAYPTTKFSTHFSVKTMQSIKDVLFQSEWQVYSWMPMVHCSAAVCVHPSITHIAFKHAF